MQVLKTKIFTSIIYENSVETVHILIKYTFFKFQSDDLSKQEFIICDYFSKFILCVSAFPF